MTTRKQKMVKNTRCQTGSNKRKIQKQFTNRAKEVRRKSRTTMDFNSSEIDREIEQIDSDEDAENIDYPRTNSEHRQKKMRTQEKLVASTLSNVGTVVTVDRRNTGNKDDVSKMGTTISNGKSVEEQYDGYKVANSQALKRFIRKRFIKDFKFCNKEIAEVVVEECHKCNELRIPSGMAWDAFMEKTAEDLVPRLFNDCRHTIQSAIRSKYLGKFNVQDERSLDKENDLKLMIAHHCFWEQIFGDS